MCRYSLQHSMWLMQLMYVNVTCNTCTSVCVPLILARLCVCVCVISEISGTGGCRDMLLPPTCSAITKHPAPEPTRKQGVNGRRVASLYKIVLMQKYRSPIRMEHLYL